MHTIYLVVDLTSGKQYVGVTHCTLSERRRQHEMPSKYRFSGTPTYFDMAIRRLGPQNFVWKALRSCKLQAEAHYWEAFYIRTLGTLRPRGYNVATGYSSTLRERLRKELILERYFRKEQ
jgi:hypothetical protein